MRGFRVPISVPLVFCYALSQLVLKEPLSQRDSLWDRGILNANFRRDLCCGDFGFTMLLCPSGKIKGQGAQMVKAVLWLLCEPQAAVLVLPHSYHVLECKKSPWGLHAAHILTATTHLCLGEE